MAEKYLTLKVTLTQLQKGKYRSRIEQSPLGASSGPGHEFTIAPKLSKQIEGFISKMPGTALGPDEVNSLGRSLFNLIFAEKVKEKYAGCLQFAREADARLRLAFVILAEPLVKVPWEYLYDGEYEKSFIIPKHSIIRVIDELKEKKAPFAPLQNLLVAIANPRSKLYRQFDDEAHRKDLEELFKRLKINHEILMHATKRDLEAKIRDQSFDALYFVGHGRLQSPEPGGQYSMGQLILEREKISDQDEDTTDSLDATTLAGWIRDSDSGQGQIRFVYLNSCSTAATDSANGATASANSFAGVAQRLLLDSKVTAVVAMQTDVEQRAAFDIAKGFFEELRRGKSFEYALTLARDKAGGHHSWGVPVIYSYLTGPEEFDKNRIACLLSADREKDSYGMILPTFIYGVLPGDFKKGKVKVEIQPPKSYKYRSETFAVEDMEAAWDVISLVSRIAPPEQIGLYKADNYPKKCSHLFLFGSKSNEIVKSLVQEPSLESSFQFHYGDYPDPKNPDPNYAGKWVLEDRKYGQPPYGIYDPAQGEPGEYEKESDIGIIEKIIDTSGVVQRVYFLISGLGDRATRGCGWYLYQCWETLLEEFGGGPFGIILRFPGGQDYDLARRVNRETGQTLKTG